LTCESNHAAAALTTSTDTHWSRDGNAIDVGTGIDMWLLVVGTRIDVRGCCVHVCVRDLYLAWRLEGVVHVVAIVHIVTIKVVSSVEIRVGVDVGSVLAIEVAVVVDIVHLVVHVVTFPLQVLIVLLSETLCITIPFLGLTSLAFSLIVQPPPFVLLLSSVLFFRFLLFLSLLLPQVIQQILVFNSLSLEFFLQFFILSLCLFLRLFLFFQGLFIILLFFLLSFFLALQR
jgi:hypothetical protein